MPTKHFAPPNQDFPGNSGHNLRNVGRCPTCGRRIELPCRVCNHPKTRAAELAKIVRRLPPPAAPKEPVMLNGNRLAETNGKPPAEPVERNGLTRTTSIAPQLREEFEKPAKPIDTLEVLARLTPEECRRALAQLELHFENEKASYLRNRKLLRLLSGSTVVRATRKHKSVRGMSYAVRVAGDQAVLDLVRGRGSIDRDGVAEALGVKRNAATMKLKALVRKGQLREKSGQFSPAK